METKDNSKLMIQYTIPKQIGTYVINNLLMIQIYNYTSLFNNNKNL